VKTTKIDYLIPYHHYPTLCNFHKVKTLLMPVKVSEKEHQNDKLSPKILEYKA
jgi:hypothetical protein